jgi:acetyl-CoA carboxylase biotin carboxyl carrier protein
MAKLVQVISEVTGSVWKTLVQPEQKVAEGDVIVIVESMKMEIPVESPCAGVLRSLAFQEGQPVREGDIVAVVEAA